MAKQIYEYNMVWFWQTFLHFQKKSTQIYDKIYDFMTLLKKKKKRKKKKKPFFGREAFYGRSEVDNQTIYFFWP